LAKVVGKHVEAKLGLVSSEVEYAAWEQQDRESCHNSNVFYRVPESDANTAAERNVADKGFSMRLLFGLNAGVAEDIRNVFRLGRRGVSDQVPKNVLVQLSSHTAKTLVMENVYKLKSLLERFRNISIVHDMMQKERDDCKAMV